MPGWRFFVRLYAAVACLAFSSFAFGQVAPVPQTAAPASPEVAPAPPHALDSIVALITDFGSNGEYTSDVLGFGTENQPWPFREIAIHTDLFDDSTSRHAFAISRGAAQDDVMVSVSDHGKYHFFRAHRNGQVVKGVLTDTITHQSAPIPTADAQKELNAEFELWDRNIDRTTHWYACMAEMVGTDSISPQRKMDACTWLIQSGKETPLDLSNAYTNRSWSYMGMNRKKQLEDLQQAVKIAPTNATAWSDLCQADNVAKKNKRDALQDCQNAVELDPKSPRGWTFRGDIDLRDKKYDLAIANYDQAIALDPEWMWPLVDRGAAYLEENQLDRALQDFNEVIRINPDFAIGFMNRGMIEMRKNELDAALADFKTACKVEPGKGKCLFGQGLVERAKGDKAAGDADMAKGRKLDHKVAKDFEEEGIHVP
jgi:tetratricopeptide (TPR) repeat protein